QAAIYAAWLVAADGKPDEAAAALEKILQQAGESPDEAVAEAADVLAMLHMARGDKEKAKKTVEFGLKVLQYHGTKDGYVLALLRNRLAVDPDEAYPEAKKLYEQAEKLRCEGKAAEAGRLFTSVCAKYPLSTWNDAAGYRIGQCLETLGRTAQAEQHWTAFVAGAPAGRWRGQARVGLVHLALVARGDLKTASQQAAAAHKILTAGVDEPAAATWNSAAVEIHLCQGIVALLEARHAAATAALGETKDHAVLQMEDPAGRFLAGLHRLTEAAERREELIPAQLAVPDEKLRLALSLGTIDNLLGRFEQAAGAFDHVLRGPVRIALQPHRSFAALGKARALVGHARDNESAAAESLASAKTAYLLSLGTLPDSAWHEHAQRELALLIEVLAARQPEALSAARTQAKAEANMKPLAPSSADVRAAVEAARAEALPYWEKLVGRSPASDYLPEALYHAGVLFSEGAKPAAEKSVAAFERLTTEFPASPWAGDAHVRLIDVKLEQQFDLPSAATHARAAADWLANVGNVGRNQRSAVPAQPADDLSSVSLPSL
ncbi:MAG: tetratricopeptide repeat protein, partial [Lentisphaerae bacterium]|nr:tetratricopeptide repeat protein [Lentisphaerota bacterium]